MVLYLSTIPGIKLEFENVGSWGEGETGPEPAEKDLSEQEREATTSSTHIYMVSTWKVWTWATLVGARRVHSPMQHPCSSEIVLTVTLLFQLQSSYEVWTTVHLILLVCMVPLVPPIHPICLMPLFIWWIFNNDRLKPPGSSCWLGIVKWW